MDLDLGLLHRRVKSRINPAHCTGYVLTEEFSNSLIFRTKCPNALMCIKRHRRLARYRTMSG